MATKGWISVHRQIWDNWVWKEKPFSKGQAWIDLLLMANHEDKKALIGNKLITVKKGSHITSIRKLCDRWGWSNTKVRSFLSLLEQDGMIDVKSDTKKTTLTIVNYSDYQDMNATKNDTETPQKRHENTTKTTRKHTNNNVNNDNNDNKEYILSSDDDPKSQKIPYQDIANMYNRICKSLPSVKIVNDSRRRAIKASWNKYKQDISVFKEVFEKAQASDFLSGRSGKWTNCNFDWLINSNNMLKVLEGTYDNRAAPENDQSNVIDYYEAAKKSPYGW